MKELFIPIRRTKSKRHQIGCYKSLVFRIDRYKKKTASFLKSNVLTFLSIICFPFYFPIILRKSTGNIFIVEIKKDSKGNRDKRLTYLEQFYESYSTTSQVDFIYNKVELKYTSITLSKLIRVFKNWINLLSSSLLLLTNSKTNASILHYSLIYSSTIILCEEKTKKNTFLYFGITNPTIYLSLILSETFSDSIHLATLGNSILYSTNRYLTLENTTAIQCAKFQQGEVNNYQKLRWMDIPKTEYWGSEDIDQTLKIKETDKIYDIGIYSSGYWARIDGLWQTDNINKIKEYEYKDNILSTLFLEVLEKTIDYAERNNLKIKIYTHPYEKKLFKLGITPLYYKLLQEHNIECDFSGESSMSKIFETYLGVSLFSSTTTDRWDFGLKAIMFDLEILKERYKISMKYIEQNKSSICHSLNEIDKVYDKHFQS